MALLGWFPLQSFHLEIEAVNSIKTQDEITALISTNRTYLGLIENYILNKRGSKNSGFEALNVLNFI